MNIHHIEIWEIDVRYIKTMLDWIFCFYWYDFDWFFCLKVAIELVDAMVGKGKACYGLTNPLQLNSPPVWLPYTVIDRLVMELKNNAQDSTYQKVRVLLFLIVSVLKNSSDWLFILIWSYFLSFLILFFKFIYCHYCSLMVNVL